MNLSSEDIKSARPITYKERSEFYEYEYTTSVDQAFLKNLVVPGMHFILEVPSGVGRNADWLAQTGCFVVQADREFNMVKRLKERIRQYNNIHIAVADMRALSFKNAFDLVIVPQGGFQLITDEDEAASALTNLSQCLARTGKLLIDLAVFDLN